MIAETNAVISCKISCLEKWVSDFYYEIVFKFYLVQLSNKLEIKFCFSELCIS